MGMPGFSENGEWEFAAGSVKGYRQWRLIISTDSSPRLIGMHGNYWGAGWQEARCLSEWRMKTTPSGMYPVKTGRHGEVPPVEDCGCGFWAYHGPEVPEESLNVQILDNGSLFTIRYVTGIMEGAGRVIMGTKGFRSQRARIVAFHAPEIRNLTTLFITHREEWPPVRHSFTNPGDMTAALRDHTGMAPWDLEARSAKFLSTFGVPAVTSLDKLRPYGPEGQPPAL